MAYEPPLTHENRKYMSKRCAGFRHFGEVSCSYPRRVVHCVVVQVMCNIFMMSSMTSPGPTLDRVLKMPRIGNILSYSVQSNIAIVCSSLDIFQTQSSLGFGLKNCQRWKFETVFGDFPNPCDSFNFTLDMKARWQIV